MIKNTIYLFTNIMNSMLIRKSAMHPRLCVRRVDDEIRQMADSQGNKIPRKPHCSYCKNTPHPPPPEKKEKSPLSHSITKLCKAEPK
jgi:hypothetical protein